VWLTRCRFLLAKFQLDYIFHEKGSRNQRKRLQTLPNTPTEAYESIRSRIESAREHTSSTAFQTLAWVLYAKRPLPIEELREALLVGEGATLEEISEEDFPPAEIIEFYESLIILEESSRVVRFTHITVQEWLSTLKASLPLIKYSVNPCAHLANTCLTYLAFNTFDEPCLDKESLERRVQNYKFSRYATQFW